MTNKCDENKILRVVVCLMCVAVLKGKSVLNWFITGSCKLCNRKVLMRLKLSHTYIPTGIEMLDQNIEISNDFFSKIRY